MVGKNVLKVEYNDLHKYASKLRGFPFTLRTKTVGILWSHKCDFTNWHAVLVHDV